MSLIALTFAPALFIFLYVYLRDKYEREPILHLFITFFLGALTPIGVLYIGDHVRNITQTSSDSEGIGLVVYAFLVVAAVEECMKFLVVRFYNYPKPEFNEPYDGIMYAVTASLGFAAVENALYVFMSDNPYEVAILRMFTAVPGHASFGAIMGFFAGLAKFSKRPGAYIIYLFFAWLMPTIVHGLYDYFLFIQKEGQEALIVVSFVVLIIGIWVSRKAIHLHAQNSTFRHQPPSEEEHTT